MSYDKLLALLPPQDPNPQVTVWRYVMAVTVAGCVLMLALMITGVIAPARSVMADQLSKELATVAAKQDAAERERLEQQVFEAKIAQCMATGPLRTLYTNRVSELVGKWQRLTGRNTNPPTLVDCNDLG